MKYMKLFFTLAILPLTSNIKTAGIFGTSAIKQLTQQQIATTYQERNQGAGGAGTTTGNPNTTCAACNSCCTQTAQTTAWPNLQISMANSSNQTINSVNFPISNYTLSSAMLIVQIFPPSNNITSSTAITSPSSDNSYVIMYTLKDPAGGYLQKAIQCAQVASGSTPATSVMSLNNNTPIIPTSISIAQLAPAVAPATTGVATPVQGTPMTAFLPSLSEHTVGTKQRIFNGISPLSLKFFLSYDGSTITATPISGMFDATEDGTITSSLLGQSGTIQATGGGSMQSITVTINSTVITNVTNGTTTFDQQNMQFTQQDFETGLSLNVHIFPPSSGSTSGSYIVIATLRTLDGLKLRKIVAPGLSLSSPSTFSINYGTSITPILTSTFANSSISSSNALNIISPINLRCLLHKNTTDRTLIVSMI